MAGIGEPGSSHKPGDTTEKNFSSEWEPSLGGPEDGLNASVNKDDPILQSNRTTFLSHSGMQKDFVKGIDLDSDSRKLMEGALSNLQRAWEIIESISEISSSVLVNKNECELIAVHFSHVAKALEDQGLDKGFAGCKVLDGGVMRVSFTKREPPKFSDDEFDSSSFFDEEFASEYDRYSFKNNSDKKILLSSFSHGSEHRTLHFLLENKPQPGQELAKFIGDLLEILTTGLNLVSIHEGLKEVHDGIVLKTGLRGEEFMRVHGELDGLLRLHSEQPLTSYSPRPDYDSTFIGYLNSNCLGGQEDLDIDFKTTSNVELANALAKMLERPDSVLKGLKICALWRRKNKEKIEWQLTVIRAVSRSTKLVRLRTYVSTEEVRELCRSLATNQSVKSLTVGVLDRGIREEGAACVGSMLAENSTLEELVFKYIYIGNHIGHIIRPLIGSDDGESPVNTSLKHLSFSGFVELSSQEVFAVARMLRTNKSLLSFRLPRYFPNDGLTNPVLKSLENNKTLQELEILFLSDDDEDFMVRLLVQHNFTLKTIWYNHQPFFAEDFIKFVHEKRGIDKKLSGGQAIEKSKFLLSNMITDYQMQPTSDITSNSSNSMLSHEIYLSYSEDGRDFAKQLYMKLRASNYDVLNDPDSSNNVKNELSTTSKEHQVAIGVLSEGYVTSKQSRLELSRFIKQMNISDSTLKVIPLFYKLTLNDFDTKNVELKWAKSSKKLINDGKFQEEEIHLWMKTTQVIFEEKNAKLEYAKALLRELIQGTINVEEFCTQFNGTCDVLDFKNYHNSEMEYLLAVVEEIKNIIPPVKKNESDQMLGYLNMFEMESKQSLQKLSFILKEESLLANQFLLQRALNKSEYLQHKYFGGNTFEATDEGNEEYGEGCIIVVLFPKVFLYHLKVQVLYGALNKASNFDDDSCFTILVDATNEVGKKWRSLCGNNHLPIYIHIAKEIAKLENIYEVSLKDVNGEGTFVLCCYIENNNEFEFYFQHHKEMASIVGVGLAHAKAILINGHEVIVEEILEEQWVKIWREAESNTNTMTKVLKLESSKVNQEDDMISNENISPKLLVWELAKFFTLKKFIEKLSTIAIEKKYITTSGDSNSKSQSSSGNDSNKSDLIGSFFKWFGDLRFTNNVSKDQDRDNDEDKEDNGDDKKGKSLENHGPNDDGDKDTTVVVKLLPGGNIMEGHKFDCTDIPKLKTLDETIVPTMEFTFINQNGSKKIQTIVGNIYFNLGFDTMHGIDEQVEWIHSKMKITFGLHEEEAKSKGEFERESVKHLDVKEGVQNTKVQKTIEKSEGKEVSGSIGASATFHGVGLTAHVDRKVTNSDGNIQQIERAYERRCYSVGDDLIFKGGLSRTEKEIVCDYAFEQPRDTYHDLSISPMGISQAVRFQGTMLPYDVGQNGIDECFVPYTLIASRYLEEIVSKESNSTHLHKSRKKRLFGRSQKKVPRENIQCVQKYSRRLYISHSMIHLNGKYYELKERYQADDESRYLSQLATPGIPYVWQHGTLVKLELQTNSMGFDSHVATTSSVASSSQA